MARVDHIAAALLVLSTNDRELFAGDYVRVCVRRDEMPADLHEATALVAVRTLEDCIQGIDQHPRHRMTTKAGSALLHHQIEDGSQGRGCKQGSPVASGIAHRLMELPSWLRVPLPYRPRCLPENFGDEDIP